MPIEQNKDKTKPNPEEKNIIQDKAKSTDDKATPTDKDSNQPLRLTKGSNTFKIFMGLVVGVIAVAILFLIVVGVGVYKYNWDNQLARWLPFPAALYEGKILSHSDYQDDLATLDLFYDAQVEQSGSAVQRPSDDYLEKSVLSRMVREKFLSEAAASFSLTVSQKEVDDEYSLLLAQAEDTEQVTKQLEELYGWTDVQFKEKVIKPYLIRLKVQQYIADDNTINEEAKKKAEEVLSLLQSGDKTFEELVTEYSDDTTASTGGDLGYFGRGQMVSEFEEAAFALEEGKTSGIVKTQYGYHIIKLIEKISATEETAEQLHAAHILIMVKDIDEWIDDELATKSVMVFVGDYEWKKDCGLVLAKSETCEDNNLLDFMIGSQDTAGGVGADTNTNTADQTE